MSAVQPYMAQPALCQHRNAGCLRCRWRRVARPAFQQPAAGPQPPVGAPLAPEWLGSLIGGGMQQPSVTLRS
jgi:hypothetical protein